MSRNVAFRENGYLILPRDELMFDSLAEWFICHQNDYVYLHENGKIVGVIQGKEFENRLRDGSTELVICTDFPFLTHEETEDRLYIYQMFDDDLTLLHLPVIENGILKGEYYDSMRTQENTERYHIKTMIPELQAFYDQIAQFFRNHEIKHLTSIIDNDDAYTQRILSGIPALDITFVHDYTAAIATGMTILDMKYPDEYRTYYKSDQSNVLTIFDVMAEVLLDAFLSYCREIRVGLVAVYAVDKKDISHLSPKDQGMMSSNKVLYDVLGDRKYLKQFYRRNESYEYATSKEVGPLGSRFVRHNGIYNYLMDCECKYINVANGVRQTEFTPENWKKEIHIFGPCIAQGLCVTDKYTVQSYLQKKLNRKHKNTYKLFNHGAATHTPYGSFCNDFLAAMDIDLHSGDTVIMFDAFTPHIFDLLRSRGVPIIQDNSMFDGTANYFLNSTYHCNHLANQKYADLIYHGLDALEMLNWDSAPIPFDSFYKSREMVFSFRDDWFLHNRELLDYVTEVKKLRLPGAENLKLGAICTQANPFTRGHLALVQKASAELDHVYIFVVQDSLGALPFLDRMDIVNDAVKELSNVTVLSCGSFMSSYRTFPDYFTVAKYRRGFDLTNVITDTKIFANLFCKALGITYRYLGEEPQDPYTSKLVQHFLEALPAYGITPVLMERASVGDRPISASTVRRLVRAGSLNEALKYATPRAVELMRRYYTRNK